MVFVSFWDVSGRGGGGVAVTLKECLFNYYEPEHLSGSDKYKCESCNQVFINVFSTPPLINVSMSRLVLTSIPVISSESPRKNSLFSSRPRCVGVWVCGCVVCAGVWVCGCVDGMRVCGTMCMCVCVCLCVQ